MLKNAGAMVQPCLNPELTCSGAERLPSGNFT
jgi:hypothetical protein